MNRLVEGHFVTHLCFYRQVNTAIYHWIPQYFQYLNRIPKICYLTIVQIFWLNSNLARAELTSTNTSLVSLFCSYLFLISQKLTVITLLSIIDPF